MNSKISLLLITCFILSFFSTKAQMEIGGQTLYGNEWIDHNQDYYKISVEDDGIYRVTYQELNNAGVFSGTSVPTGSQFKLYHNGVEVPVFVSNSGSFGASDFIEFYGVKNRGELDVHLYEDPNNQLNPKYSLFSDISNYFLTWNNDAGQQFQDVSNNLTSTPSAEPYCMMTKEEIFNNVVVRGRDYSSSSWRSAYDLGEGFSRGSAANSLEVDFSLPHLYPGVDGYAQTRGFSTAGSHMLGIDVNGNTVVSENYTGWTVKQVEGVVDASFFNTGNNTFTTFANPLNPDDKFRMVFVNVEYPSTFNFDNESSTRFKLPASSIDRYMEITNFDHGGQAPILFDLTNNQRIVTNLNAGTVEVLLPAATGERDLILVSAGSVGSPMGITKRQFVDYDFANTSYDYIIVTHSAFFDDGNGNNLVQDYADYRASLQGGGYEPIIVDVLDLYDQFGYGVDRYEQAIKNFLKVAADNWSPKLLFLIGKGVTYELMRTNPTSWEHLSFVPSFGYPSSDHLFVSPLGNIATPSMGVGRLAAKSTDDIELYLNKVIEYETVPDITNQTIDDKEWMKKILHFGGGDALIQDLIRDELNVLKDTIEGSQLGAEVTSFFKNSSDIVDGVDLDQVIPLINEGAMMLTFFGHSAPSTLDFDLGNPNEYDNEGKYPLFYAIGCNTNRIFEVESTLSEDFVLIENKGCIGFFGATWITNLSNLSQYGRYFYSNMGNDNYGQSIGEIIKATIEDYSFSGNYTAELLRNALVLHGDPALRLYPFEAPDYLVKTDESGVTPSIVNALDSGFELDLTISNIGRVVNDSFNLRFEHELPNGDIIDLGTQRVRAPSFKENWQFDLPLLSSEALGLNYINITIDDNDEIAEGPTGAELNNTDRVPFFVVSNDIFPVYPYEFSIISDDSPTLRASTANVFSEALDYYIQIDTTELFNSPLFESSVINQVGGVLDWEPNIQMMDSIVYYWRVSIDSTAINGDFNWHNSSFVYIPNSSPGWNQSHFWQFTKDEFTNIQLDSTNYDFDYSNRDYEFHQIHSAADVLPWAEITVFKEGFDLTSYYHCSGADQDRYMWAMGLDPTILEIGNSEVAPAVDFNCFIQGGTGLGMIRRPQIASEREEMMAYLEDSGPDVVPDGHYVLFYTFQRTTNDYAADEWDTDTLIYGRSLFTVLEGQGAYNVRNIETNQTPYICVFKKNDPSFQTLEFHANDVNEVLDVFYNLIGKANTGKVNSTVIGPASNWETLLWDVEEYDPATENVSVDIIGIDGNGNETLIVDNLTDYDYALSGIDADEYPYIRLEYESDDSTNFTYPILDYWRVMYDPIPEAALVPNKLFSFHNDTIQQGETLSLEIGVENIGNVDMDSMLMHYTIVDPQNNQILETARLEPLLKDEMIVGQLSLDTRNLVGRNQLIIEANPNSDQPELYHYNNVGIRSFFVQEDLRNPLLDVTFDGIHIMDGDLVSSRPEVIISLLDENPFLALSDTSLLRLFVTDPLGNTEEYEVDGNVLTFFPASGDISDENRARMEFRPDLQVDGTYQLEVRGEDASGNDSGEFDYRVNFEVVNEETVSNVLNYPNPFSTSTQFVFTLTGNELPDVFRIQIMTVSGKIVKEIDMGELGPLRIGNNITDYRWDGTDDFGDKLANGVYLYRVVVKKDGENYESYDNGTNQYFKKGFGKMVILR